ncbi:MAG: hypothetical protein KC423_06705 [Anaerolineales bacterium]|nr:hypothetical protein [Anaerolineales bacterium]
MFESLPLIAVVIILLWLAVFVYYLTTSRSQQTLEQEIEALKKILDDDEKHT